MVTSRYARTIRLALQRVGEPANVLRSSGGSTNMYGKTDGVSWGPVGSWMSFRSYQYRSDRPEQTHTGAGERDIDTPVFYFPDTADIQNGDRIVYESTEYEVTADPVSYSTHYEVRTTKVDKS